MDDEPMVPASECAARVDRAILKERERCKMAVMAGPFPLLTDVILERIDKPHEAPTDGW